MKAEKHEVWEEYYSALSRLPERLKMPVPFVIDALPLFKNKVETILDLGCGGGRHCVYLAKNGFNIFGIDMSKSALKTAKAWSKIEKIANAMFLCASMTNLPFFNESFDAVISVSVIHHAVKKDIGMTIEEILRVLKDNGIFLANLLSVKDYRYGSGQKIEERTFRVSEDFQEKRFEEIHHFFTRKEIINLLANFGKANIESIQGGKKEQLHQYWEVIAVK